MSTMAGDERSRKPNRFDPPGISFKAKLIGLEDVTDPRGDKMCQVAMAKLKAAVVAMGEHKQRVNVNISLEGIKVIDEKTENVLHHHPVHRISFIARDANDSRAFGYVYNREDGVHQFCGIKTEKAAEPLVTCLRDLFQTVVELKKEREKETAKNDTTTTNDKDKKAPAQGSDSQAPAAAAAPAPDLLGLDSGVTAIDRTSSATAAASGAWLDVNLFQSAPAATAPVATQNISSLHMLGGAVPVDHYHPQQGAQPLFRQPPPPQYAQVIPGLQPLQQQQYQQSAPFSAYPSSFHLSNPAVGAAAITAGPPSAWPPIQSAPPHVLVTGSVTVSHPQASTLPPKNAGWTSFGDLGATSAANHHPGQQSSPFAAAAPPLQSTSVQQATNDPFAATTKFPDPFADLAFISSGSGAGKKVSKDDFIKEPPKPTLLDLSQQQQRQPSGGVGDLPPPAAADAAADPFSIVSLQPRSTALYQPPIDSHFPPTPTQQQQVRGFPPSTNPFASDYYQSVGIDKSPAQEFAAVRSSAFVDNGGTGELGSTSRWSGQPTSHDQGNSESVAMSRPRPKSNAGTKASLLLPLNPKNQDPFGINSSSAI